MGGLTPERRQKEQCRALRPGPYVQSFERLNPSLLGAGGFRVDGSARALLCLELGALTSVFPRLGQANGSLRQVAFVGAGRKSGPLLILAVTGKVRGQHHGR